MINNWVSSSKELQLLVDDYLLTVNYRSVIENDLVNYTQGIESYFRNERLTLRDKINKFIEELPLRNCLNPIENYYLNTLEIQMIGLESL